MQITTRTRRISAVLALCGALAACGETFGEQALYGAGAGAGTAALVDGNIYTGAALGAAANLLYCQQNASRCN